MLELTEYGSNFLCLVAWAIYIYIYIAESWGEVEADIWAEAEHELGMRVYEPGVLIVD